MKKAAVLILASLTFVGCENDQIEIVNVHTAPAQLEQQRFAITNLAEFNCDLAYNGKRRIYEITDTKTGKTYLGVTGLSLDQIKKEIDEAVEDLVSSSLGDLE